MDKPKILVVDDELHLTHIVKIKLEQSGFAVRTANNGEEGFRSATEDVPNLIVSDFEMPRLNGFEMCVRLHETQATSEIPIVMLTARGHKLAPSEMAKTNIVHLLDKPFGARELINIVSEILGHDLEAVAVIGS